MPLWLRGILLIASGLVVSAIVSVFGTLFVCMLIATLATMNQVGPNDGELFTAMMIGSFIMPFVFLFGVVITVWLWARMLHNRVGCCRKCGYNLTGNTTGTCPECGTPRPVYYPPLKEPRTK